MRKSFRERDGSFIKVEKIRVKKAINLYKMRFTKYIIKV